MFGGDHSFIITGHLSHHTLSRHKQIFVVYISLVFNAIPITISTLWKTNIIKKRNKKNIVDYYEAFITLVDPQQDMQGIYFLTSQKIKERYKLLIIQFSSEYYKFYFNTKRIKEKLLYVNVN